MDTAYITALQGALSGAADDVVGILQTAAPVLLIVTVSFVGFRVVRRLVAGVGR
jgi:hypothetical protein